MADYQRSQQCPVQTSAVFVLNAPKRPPKPPPSPPSDSVSPPDTPSEPLGDLDLNERSWVETRRVDHGLRVLGAEARALKCLEMLYETDVGARDGFSRAVEAIISRRQLGSKLVISGVGKSGHIGRKLVATFQSLGIQTVFLHPTEALHGDLGVVGPHDTLMFITFSGKTSELMQLLPHLLETLQLIILTSHTRRRTCELLRNRPDGILLPAPIPEPETVSSGVSAPTSSTTTALALGDALAIAAAKELHPSVHSVFLQNHPGGSIGSTHRRTDVDRFIDELATPWADIPVIDNTHDDVLGIDLLRTGFGSPAKGWICVKGDNGVGVAQPTMIRRLSSGELTRKVGDIPGLLVSREGMTSVPQGTSIDKVELLLRERRWDEKSHGEGILAVVDGGEIVGVVDIESVRNRASRDSRS